MYGTCQVLTETHTWLFLSWCHRYPAMTSRLLWQTVKACEKTYFRQRSKWCNCNKTSCIFIFHFLKASWLLTPLHKSPPCIMLLRWCHIDYADHMLRLFIPRFLPSLICPWGWAEVTLNAIFFMFSAFLGYAVEIFSPTRDQGGSPFSFCAPG